MRCTCADEVLLLLKSSDRVAHDISDAVPETAKAAGWNKECPQPKHTLALREWHEVHPDREFRCFVVDGTLKGTFLSQVINADTFSRAKLVHRWPHLTPEPCRD